MKKLLQLVALFFIAIGFAQNNADSFDWSFNGGGGFNSIKRLNYNSQGDLFSLIDAGHQTTFGGTAMLDPGYGSFPGTLTFIGKRTQSGTSTVFVKKNLPNASGTSIQDFVIDSDDNIIITGSTFGYGPTIFYDFGNGVTLYGKGNYVAKYNPQGICQWAKLVTYNITGSLPYSENKPIALGVLPNNDIYFANRSTNGTKPFWLLKLSSAGTEIWHKEWILPISNSVAILTSKNNFFFDNTGKAYFYIYSIQGDLVTIDGIALTPPPGGHPSTTSLLTINGDGSNGVFSTYRGAFGDLAVEKASGNVLLDWGQYVVNPAPFNTVSYNIYNQYIGVVALDSNRNYINSSAALFTNQFESIYPLGNLNFVANSLMYATETLTIPNQTYTTPKHTPTWKFFENLVMTKFIAHPEINGINTASANTMALYNSKLAVSGSYSLTNNPTILVNGTTLTTCNNDPNFATLYPTWAASQGDVFISQLTISTGLAVTQNKLTNFEIYPNPTDNNLNLIFEKTLENASLKISSILGQTILEKQNLSGTIFSFDVSSLSNGTYIIQVSDGVLVHNSKFIKQ
ncbi:T9SS type A sorting domain-containing protein [Flavobacterium sp.]|uniref:T9SS type A sorting domain-containing protein n=1 Tax=Flavobacterium sp. TaxID=239 RepID=UPI00286AE71F|nr:T9SS type A sorting domain-containing protein [Flavobacterium sp.]